MHLPLVADRAFGIGRSSEDVLDDGPALSFVGIEQVRVRPPAQHPHELPAEIESVVDRCVHAGTAARCHTVGSVADQERAAGTEAVRELGHEREIADPLDVDGEVGDAGAAPDQVREPLRCVVREIVRSGSQVRP